MHELEIAMLGARGIGKTSLLTVMYHCFEAAIGQTDLQLNVDVDSAGRLQDRLVDLQRFPEEIMHNHAGIPASANPESFDFELGRRAKPPSLHLRFHDYPGGYLADSVPDHTKHVNKLATDCAAILIPVDGPALMERDGYWHREINRPDQIGCILKRAFTNLTSPRMVVFAPVRCEKYLYEDASGKLLLSTFRERYQSLLQQLACPERRGNVAVAVVPVETVGSVHFSHVKTGPDGEPIFCFTKRDFRATFEPRHTDQILSYVLRFLLALHIRQRRWPWPFDRLRTLFSNDEHLRLAVEQFVKHSRTTPPFAILQGEELLKL